MVVLQLVLLPAALVAIDPCRHCDLARATNFMHVQYDCCVSGGIYLLQLMLKGFIMRLNYYQLTFKKIILRVSYFY